MKEAIANAGVFNLIIIFVIILIFFFVGSLSYSKAFKVKNKIVSEIEKNQGYNSSVRNDLENWLKEIGYKYKGGVGAWGCPSSSSGGFLSDISSVYDYCVYKHDVNSGGVEGIYYSVTAYMYIELPIINNVFRFPVHGETITFINNVDG